MVPFFIVAGCLYGPYFWYGFTVARQMEKALLSYRTEFEKSLSDPISFWREQARRVAWSTAPETILAKDANGNDKGQQIMQEIHCLKSVQRFTGIQTCRFICIYHGIQ